MLFSLVAANECYSLVALPGLLLVGASLVVKDGPREWGLPVDVALRLSCPAALATFTDQGLKPCRLHWQVDSYPLDHQGSPSCEFFINAFYHVADVPFYSQFIECLVVVFLIMKGCLILSNAFFCIN